MASIMVVTHGLAARVERVLVLPLRAQLPVSVRDNSHEMAKMYLGVLWSTVEGPLLTAENCLWEKPTPSSVAQGLKMQWRAPLMVAPSSLHMPSYTARPEELVSQPMSAH